MSGDRGFTVGDSGGPGGGDALYRLDHFLRRKRSSRRKAAFKGFYRSGSGKTVGGISMSQGTKLVIDLETQRTFEEVGGRNYEDLLVSVLGIYRYDSDQYECYL